MKTLLLAIIFGALLCCGASDALPTHIDHCGWLRVSHSGCILFQSTDGGEEYVTDLLAVPDSLEHTPIKLEGDVLHCDPACSPYYYDCIIGTVVTTCEPTNLGCGVLNEDTVDFCHTWTSLVYGTLLTQMHGRSDGDTVRVVGIIDRTLPSVCMFGDGGLFNESFYDCPDTLSAVMQMTWGNLKGLFR
jgi:hypothetical protein